MSFSCCRKDNYCRSLTLSSHLEHLIWVSNGAELSYCTKIDNLMVNYFVCNRIQAGTRANNLLAVDKLNWPDNFRLQEALCLSSFKILIKIKFGRLNAVPMRTNLPMFFQPELSLEQFIYGIAGEITLLQVSFNFLPHQLRRVARFLIRNEID